MKKFILYDNRTDVDIKTLDVEISPTLVETLDESLDNMTITLKINQDPYPLKPRIQSVRFVEVLNDNSEQIINRYNIVADNVELVAQNPNRYKHVVTLSQTSQDLTKHLIRNNVFSTSLQGDKYSFAVGGFYWYDYVHQAIHPEMGQPSITIDLSTTKIYDLSMSINAKVFKYITNALGDYRLLFPSTTDMFVESDESVYKWSDLYKNNTNGVVLQVIHFTIDGVTKDWTLSADQLFGEKVPVPSDIVDWIKASTSTLTVSVDSQFPSDISGFDLFDISSSGGVSTHYLVNSIPNFNICGNIMFEFYGALPRSKNVYEVIQDLLKQYRKDTALYHDEVDLFKLPNQSHNEELYNLLNDTVAPNFTFTQCSMFDALSEIFKLFDATFRIDNSGYLDIEYYNDHKPRNITDSDKTGRSSSLGEERFANKLVTYFQNTKINDRFPNSNEENATAYLRSKTLGVPGESDFVFVVPKPIDIITKVVLSSPEFKIKSFTQAVTRYGQTCTIKYYFGGVSFFSFLDITDNVVESDIWSILDVSPANNYNIFTNKKYKQNTLNYKRGTKYIDIANYYNLTDYEHYNMRTTILGNVYLAGILRTLGIVDNSYINWDITVSQTPDWRNVKLYVEYIALVDGKLVNESYDYKAPGEILTNQNNGSIDINKLGLNMVGLSMKLGQPTLNLVQNFTTWSDRIKKGEYFIDELHQKWVANNCSYTFIKSDVIQANIEFVKNFNGLASRIELNREKRLSNISNELTIKCEDDYGEYVYYCDRDLSEMYESGEQIHLKNKYVQNLILMSMGLQLPYSTVGTVSVASMTTLLPTALQWSFLLANNGDGLHPVFVAGYAGGGESFTDNGGFTLHEGYDEDNEVFDGASVYIPMSTSRQTGMQVNEMTNQMDVFVYDDFNTRSPTKNFADNPGAVYSVGAVILKNKDNEIVGAVISSVGVDTGFHLNGNYTIYEPSNTYNIEYALITALNKNGEIIKNEDTGEVKNIAIPMVVYGAGNSVCFEMSFDSPISAGNQLLDDYTSAVWVGGWFSKAVLYTDIEGQAEKFTIDFVKLKSPITREYPVMKNDDHSTYIDTYSFGKIEEYGYYKKPNEIFALNYQLHFMPRNKVFVAIDPAKNVYYDAGFLSNEFIKHNAFANGFNGRQLKFVYCIDPTVAYSVFDTKGHQIEKTSGTVVTTDIKNITFTSGNHYLTINFIISMTEQLQNSITSWAIVDENDNIYYCSNNKTRKLNVDNESTFVLTFFTRHHRFQD